MAVLQLPVSTFTRKYFERRYHAQRMPYLIIRSDIFYRHLSWQASKTTHESFIHKNNLLVDAVHLQVADSLERWLTVRHRRFEVGEHLHKVCQDRMLCFVEAQVEAGKRAYGSIKYFLSLYDIDEDVYSVETAYTAWKRHKRIFFPKNEEKSAKFWASSVPIIEHEFCASKTLLPVPTKRILKAVNDYFECGYQYLLCQCLMTKRLGRIFEYHYDEGLVRTNVYPRKILAYLLYEHGQMTYERIEKIIQRDKARLHSYVQEVKLGIELYDEILQDVQTIEQQLR